MLGITEEERADAYLDLRRREVQVAEGTLSDNRSFWSRFALVATVAVPLLGFLGLQSYLSFRDKRAGLRGLGYTKAQRHKIINQARQAEQYSGAAEYLFSYICKDHEDEDSDDYFDCLKNFIDVAESPESKRKKLKASQSTERSRRFRARQR